MKSIYLSRHAIRRMQLYNITEDQVAKTVKDPDSIIQSVKGRYNAYGKSGEIMLRVTYLEEETRYIIVTVTPRKRF